MEFIWIDEVWFMNEMTFKPLPFQLSSFLNELLFENGQLKEKKEELTGLAALVESIKRQLLNELKGNESIGVDWWPALLFFSSINFVDWEERRAAQFMKKFEFGLPFLLGVMGGARPALLRNKEENATKQTQTMNEWSRSIKERVKSTNQRQAAIQRNQFIDWIWMERQLVWLIERGGEEANQWNKTLLNWWSRAAECPAESIEWMINEIQLMEQLWAAANSNSIDFFNQRQTKVYLFFQPINFFELNWME